MPWRTLRAAGAVLGGVVGPRRAGCAWRARPAWSWCARGSARARRRCARGAPCARRRAPRATSAPRGLRRAVATLLEALATGRRGRSGRLLLGRGRSLLGGSLRRRQPRSPRRPRRPLAVCVSVGLGGLFGGLSHCRSQQWLSRSGRRRAGGRRSAPARGRAWRAACRAVFSSSPVACCMRRPKTSRRAVAMCSRSLSSRDVSELGGLHHWPSSRMHELGLDGQLVAGQAHRLARQRLVDAGQLEHDAARLDDGHPALGVALAGAHAGLGRLLREGLVGEDVDPHLAATLDLARHGDTSGLDLAVGQPARSRAPSGRTRRTRPAAGRARGRARRPRCCLRYLTRFGDSITG